MRLTRRRLIALAAAFLIAAPLATVQAADRFIVVASTTSTQDSGLYDYLLPIFAKKTGIEVRVVAKGTGEAIKLAEAGDADVLLVHNKPSEEKFVAEGYGVKRYQLMYNDFLIVGPKSDPAGIAGTKDVVAALKRIAETKAPFVSRGDDSGTYKAEMALWKLAATDPKPASGTWYREAGAGMGPTLNTSAAMNAYTLTDRATWIHFQNKGDLVPVVQGDERLFNQYGVTLVNPAKFAHVKATDGQAFIDWLISPEGQQAIAGYQIDGQQLFFPNAQPGS